ncbi:hypothetical protein FC19_GL000500 [Liquorilactobacillus aquaticus DSM 21051]|uniref:Transposase InsH N-terminal domain-containing protein n=1 Tax=Liquorilactobacillus aquaticus DSM 21051 TaxID=1423725 RepID=A0A0R2CYN9_9LACO|nr:hypothetical protein FC19_GL000500 [Liquorilactobacillus aquaticus DSM 21051]
MVKLVLLAYSYGIFSSRKIERFARENKPASWLISVKMAWLTMYLLLMGQRF